MPRNFAVLFLSLFVCVSALAQNSPVPTTFDDPVIGFAGRYIDSANTRDWQTPATLRAGRIGIAPELDRIFMIASGDRFVSYRLSTFPESLTSPKSEHVHGEQYVPFLTSLSPYEPGSGWQTFVFDAQQKLFDFDWNASGMIALAFSINGWGLVELDGTLIYQMPRPESSPVAIELIRAEGREYVLVGSRVSVDIYDVTDPAAPTFIRTLPFGAREFAQIGDSGLVGIVTPGSQLQVYAPTSMIAGLPPLGTFADIRALTSDLDRLYGAGVGILIVRAEGENLVESRYPGGGYGIGVGAGYLVTYSYPVRVGDPPSFRFHTVVDGVPTFVGTGAIGDFYVMPYSRFPSDVALVPVDGRTLFLAAMHGLGDVYDLAQAPADLIIEKTADATVVDVGSQVTYAITVRNIGAGTATEVRITDELPAGMSLVSATSELAECSGTSTVTCTIAELASGGVLTIQLVARVDAPGSFANTATVFGVGDSDATNNSSTAATVDAPGADLVITKAASTAQVEVGSDLTYTITARNDGPGVARQVQIVDVLPQGLSLVSVSTDAGSCTGSSTITCDVPEMISGSVVTVALVVRAVTGGSFVNTATISSAADANVMNNAASAPAVAAFHLATVPTLSEYGLLFLGLALAVLALRMIR